MTARRATAEDIPWVADVLAEAFAGDAPMRWFLAESPRSHQILRRYFAAVVPRVYIRMGEVWVSDEPLGAALWLAPADNASPRGQVAGLPALVRTFGRHPVRAVAGQRAIERGHPREPHWYLDYIGVDAASRSHGIGSELLRPVLDRCDAEGSAAALNAGSERSRDLYARHGFEVTERFELPFGGPPLWRMWREPAGRRPGKG